MGFKPENINNGRFFLYGVKMSLLVIFLTSYSNQTRFLTFLRRGWLGFAHIRSTFGPDLPRASRTLRMDAHFRQGLPRKKVRRATGDCNKTRNKEKGCGCSMTKE